MAEQNKKEEALMGIDIDSIHQDMHYINMEEFKWMTYLDHAKSKLW